MGLENLVDKGWRSCCVHHLYWLKSLVMFSDHGLVVANALLKLKEWHVPRIFQCVPFLKNKVI